MMQRILQRVLYVDDEPDIQEIAAMALELDGSLTVRTCGSGGEALAEAKTFAPDLIMLDVMMPGMDGPTTLARLREDPAFDRVPVIFITAKVQREEVERFRQIGAADVIAKPFDPMTLATRVRAIWDALPRGPE